MTANEIEPPGALKHRPGDAESPDLPPNGRRRLSPARMYSLFAAGDASYDGSFFPGVLTTRIYCLPSCKARKPNPRNVRFYPSVEAARADGLRPCRKCHPDDFARGADPVLATIEALVSEIRRNPAAFPSSAAIVRRSGFGASRLFELFRQHYHATPAAVHLQARLRLAKSRLIESDAGLASIAYDTGFEALSSFHENFRRFNGVTPTEYRRLRSSRTFVVTLPGNYPLPYLRRALSRDPHAVSERLQGNEYAAAVVLDGSASVLRLRLSERVVQVEISEGSAVRTHELVSGILGLEQDAAGFARLARRLGLERLVSGREGLRISQTHSVFEGLLWSIIGQQINFPFACLLKSRLVERTGTPMGGGLWAPPSPDSLANLTRNDLLKLQFSRRKADYVLGLARQVVEGKLKVEDLSRCSATGARRTLLAVHGLGPWSVNYVMMRSLGFADCVPLGDTGVSSGLQALLKLDVRPDIEAVHRLTMAFSPLRSLATAHLWQLTKPLPA